jgi:hypothetical protein
MDRVELPTSPLILLVHTRALGAGEVRECLFGGILRLTLDRALSLCACAILGTQACGPPSRSSDSGPTAPLCRTISTRCRSHVPRASMSSHASSGANVGGSASGPSCWQCSKPNGVAEGATGAVSCSSASNSCSSVRMQLVIARSLARSNTSLPKSTGHHSTHSSVCFLTRPPAHFPTLPFAH